MARVQAGEEPTAEPAWIATDRSYGEAGRRVLRQNDHIADKTHRKLTDLSRIEEYLSSVIPDYQTNIQEYLSPGTRASAPPTMMGLSTITSPREVR